MRRQQIVHYRALSQTFSPSMLWSRMSSGFAGHQVLSESVIWFYCQHLHLRSHISVCHPSLYPLTFFAPSPLSLSLSLYLHLSHHYNIFLRISSAHMSILLKRSSPHVYCDSFYFGLLLYIIICYMVFPIHIVNVSKHPHLSCTYLLQYWQEQLGGISLWVGHCRVQSSVWQTPCPLDQIGFLIASHPYE